MRKHRWKLFQKRSKPRVKPLFYVHRVLLNRPYLLRPDIIELNLITLIVEHHLPYIQDLPTQRLECPEKEEIYAPILDFRERDNVLCTYKLEDDRKNHTY